MSASQAYWLAKAELGALLAAIEERGYRLLAQTVSDGALMWGRIDAADALPWGVRDLQSPGSYRLRAGDEGRCFDALHGPQSLKNLTFAPSEPLMRVAVGEEGLDFQALLPEETPIAIIGARACDLAALSIQERIFLGGEHADAHFQAHYQSLFIVAVNCTRAASTCFCAAMGTGPGAEEGFDLALTELDKGFLVEAGSESGEAVLAGMSLPAASREEQAQAQTAVAACADMQTRGIDQSGLPQALYDAREHPRWQEVAQRCLSCANCTMVCPTCFCHRVEEKSDLEHSESVRTRIWDSCFSPDHGYIHGKNMRPLTADRYRMWLTHKLGSWIDQFDTSGCVGCGRCISWCPTGIDLTEEVAAILERP